MAFKTSPLPIYNTEIAARGENVEKLLSGNAFPMNRFPPNDHAFMKHDVIGETTLVLRLGR